MTTRILLISLSQSLIAFAVGHAETQSRATQNPVQVPLTTLVPVTPDSYPLGAADHLNVPEDLSKVGYVEEEYFVSGVANVYEWAAPGAATVGVANAPYTIRMLVRRPVRKERLSGNVIVEILNATNLVDLETGWALSKSQFTVLSVSMATDILNRDSMSRLTLTQYFRSRNSQTENRYLTGFLLLRDLTVPSPSHRRCTFALLGRADRAVVCRQPRARA
jgi:hypothetical protein